MRSGRALAVEARARRTEEQKRHELLTPELRKEVIRLARHYGARGDLVEDIAQEVLLTLWRRPEALEQKNEGLLVTIVKRRTHSALRKQGRYNARFVPLEDEPADEDEGER
jgi:DNA-directed RNA polymerase specialized sigma24 family protein